MLTFPPPKKKEEKKSVYFWHTYKNGQNLLSLMKCSFIFLERGLFGESLLLGGAEGYVLLLLLLFFLPLFPLY
jgi:hypothetical protein